MYSNKLKKAFSESSKLAFQNGLSRYPLELLVAKILETDKDVFQFLVNENIDAEGLLISLKEMFYTIIESNKNVVEYPDLDPDLDILDEMDEETIADIWVSEVLARSYLDFSIKEYGSIVQKMTAYNILAAIPTLEESPTSELFKSFGINRSLFIDKINNVDDDDFSDEFSLTDQDDNFHFNCVDNELDHGNGFNQQEEKEQKSKNSNVLIDLVKMAKENKLEKLIGRESELNKIEIILSRKCKKNPILTGESGVGKTSLINGLAYRIANDEVPDSLKGQRLFLLSVGALVAGTKFRGEFEDRLLRVIKKAQKDNAILFIDEIHTILGAGKGEGAMDAANILKPYLSNGTITVIGATTNDEYIRLFDKDKALSRRFNEVNIPELTMDDTIQLMLRIKSTYEDFHNVVIDNDAILEIVSLSNRYILNRQFPDKSIDLLDEVCSVVKLNNIDKIVKNEDVFSVISRITNVPIDSMRDNESNKAIISLEKNLLSNVFGQEKAVSAVSESMMLSYAGLKPDNKPMGSFLFTGPTGVGKTELAKTLANQLNMNLVRYDMSEFMEKQTISKFLGSSPGYVGSDEQSSLDKELRKNPYSVVLFDEFEKAHPDIKNIFLSVLDEGYVKDSKGSFINFKNCIIIFTSNVGVVTNNQGKNGIGFNTVHQETKIDMEEVKRNFPPEWRNRLTGIIEFNPLTESITTQIANKAISQIRDLVFSNKGVKIEWTSPVSSFIAKEGFDPSMGARPIERKAVELISKPLSKLILTNNLKDGDVIKIHKNDGKIVFSLTVS